MMKRPNNQHRPQGGGAPEQFRPGPERYFYGQGDRRTQQKYRRSTDFPGHPEQSGQHNQNYFASTHPYPHTVGDEGRHGSQQDMPRDAWRPGEYVGWRENYAAQPTQHGHGGGQQASEGQYPGQHVSQGYGREAGVNYQRSQQSDSQYDPDYHLWREAQMRQFDEDYDRWRKERYNAFAEEFARWRGSRQQAGPSGLVGTAATIGQHAGGAGAVHPHIKDAEVGPNPENRATTGITSTKTE